MLFRRALLAGLTVIMAGGLGAAVGSGTAVAAPPPACSATVVIEITHFAFNPPAVTPGQSSAASLTALNCTSKPQQASEIWYGRFVDSTGGIPTGCPVIDPIAFSVDFPAGGAVTTGITYTVPPSCTATQLVVTVRISGNNGVLFATGTAVLEIVRVTG